MKSAYQMMEEYLESNPKASGYDIEEFAKAHNISYSGGGASESVEGADKDSGKMVYSEEEWDALTKESIPETKKGAGNDSFDDDDKHYLSFLQAEVHLQGFILNTTRKKSSYAVLHKASCHTIQGVPTAGQRWTTGDYCKVWAESLDELQEWVIKGLPGGARLCGTCKPMEEKDSETIETSAAEKEAIIDLATEGGGETIYRRMTDNGWIFGSDGSTMSFNEDDRVYSGEWNRPEAADLASVLPSIWPRLSPIQIHSEWHDWFRQAYSLFLSDLSKEERTRYEAFGSRRRRWEEMLGGTGALLPFAAYPFGGRSLIGRVAGSNCRHGYGLQFIKKTGQTCCAYCGLDFAGAYQNWLQMALDHVVPTRTGAERGIQADWLDDSSNKVLACTACNGFRNRYQLSDAEVSPKTLDEFFDLRDRVFTERKARVTESHLQEKAFFGQSPWSGS